MNINKNSWHYRLMASQSMNIPTSLCPYFWKVVFTLMVWTVAGLLVGGMFTAVGESIFSDVMAQFGYDFGPIINHVAGLFVGAATIIIPCGLAIFGMVNGTLKYEQYKDRKWNENYEKRQARIKAGLPAEEEPNILVAFIKANHRKVCPMLEFVDKK